MTTISRHQPPLRRLSSMRVVAALVILSVAALVACSGSPNRAPSPTAAPTTATSAMAASGAPVAAPLPALGVELPAGQIPWSQVGPGWMLATWSQVPGLRPGETPAAGQPDPAQAPVTLYLVDPAGGRYPITTFAPKPDGAPELADWSGDGKHALFKDESYDPTGRPLGITTMTQVDLATGAKQTFTVGSDDADGAYSRPTGQAILLKGRFGSGPVTLERVDLSGSKQLTFPTDLGAAGKFSGAYLESADGTQLAFGADKGMVVVGNDGVVSRQLPMPVPVTDCSPVRWWTPTVILARCTVAGSPFSGSQLWQVPLDGGAPTALTAAITDGNPGPDYGDTDAWQLPSGTFLQSLGACGSIFLSRLTPDGHTTPVTVPGVNNEQSVVVTGVTPDRLVLRAAVGCGSGISLLTYDPVANTSAVLLGPPVNGGGVIHAILYPTP